LSWEEAHDSQTIQNFYDFGISAIRAANSDMLFIIHDAFLSLYEWTSFPRSTDKPNAVLDTHHYEGWCHHRYHSQAVFGSTFDLEGQINDVCDFGNSIFYDGITTVVGEFCGAQTDCDYPLPPHLMAGTKYLNGYGTGARYSGTLNSNVFLDTLPI
jgi:glucan 1,3-beta-glucosidase